MQLNLCLPSESVCHATINEEHTTEYFLENILVTNFRLKNLLCNYNIHQIFVKFSIEVLYKKLSRNMGFVKINSVTAILYIGM